ncbi:MAG: M1 family aminopeptidase [bacterium]
MNGRAILTAVVALVVVAVLVLIVRFVSGPTAEPNLGEIPEMTLIHNLDPGTHTLTSSVDFTWTKATVDTFFFLLNRNLSIDHVEADGGVMGELLLVADGEEVGSYLARWSTASESSESHDHLALYAIPISGREEKTQIHLGYHGEIHDVVQVPEFSRWEIADETTGIIDPQGAFLTPWTGYYPVQPGESSLSIFNTTMELPGNWEGLVEGNIVDRSNQSITFSSVHPVDGCYLVAGPYKLKTLQAGDMEVAMYYYTQSEPLVDRYLGLSAKYLMDYNRLIGRYPFNRFSVVENWFPTGYGMPSYTLLGSQVLALPFIPFTSLPHEIAHNWWGNGCLVEYESGNWCEGLTVYSADYRLKVETSPEAAKQYRMDDLRDYSDYVIRGDEEDFPLSDFTSRTTAGTRTIGYGKSMMVFHMVEKKIGHDPFWIALRKLYAERQFTRVSWSDIFDYFTETSGEDFRVFQKQWINRTGAPEFAVENVQTHFSKNGARIEFDLKQAQQGDPFVVDVPITVKLDGDSVFMDVLRGVRGRMYHARVEVPGHPVELEIDPDFHLFRVLDPKEAPPTLAGFYGADNPVVVVPESGAMAESYRQFAENFFRRGNAEIITASQYSSEVYAGRSVMMFGETETISAARDAMTASGTDLSDKAMAIVGTSRDMDDPSRVNIVLWASSPDALAPIASKLPHYGKYSYLAFANGQNVGKGQWEVTESPLRVSLER